MPHSRDTASPLEGYLTQKESWQFAAQSDSPLLNLHHDSTEFWPTGCQVQDDPQPELFVFRGFPDQRFGYLGDEGHGRHQQKFCARTMNCNIASAIGNICADGYRRPAIANACHSPALIRNARHVASSSRKEQRAETHTALCVLRFRATSSVARFWIAGGRLFVDC